MSEKRNEQSYHVQDYMYEKYTLYYDFKYFYKLFSMFIVLLFLNKKPRIIKWDEYFVWQKCVYE